MVVRLSTRGSTSPSTPTIRTELDGLPCVVDDWRIANIAAAIATVARICDARLQSTIPWRSLAAMRKLVIPLVVLAVAGGASYWLKARDDDAATEHKAQQQATEAMADVNAKQTTIADRLKKATLEVATTALVSVAKAGTSSGRGAADD